MAIRSSLEVTFASPVVLDNTARGPDGARFRRMSLFLDGNRAAGRPVQPLSAQGREHAPDVTRNSPYRPKFAEADVQVILKQIPAGAP